VDSKSKIIIIIMGHEHKRQTVWWEQPARGRRQEKDFGEGEHG
jgi:hypothetical protein